MTYNNAIPQPTDLISNSQSQILENFAQLDKQYGTSATSSGGAGIGDHVAFSGSSNNGYHIQVRFPSAPSAPTTTGTQSALYPVANATTGQQELYFQNSSTEYAGGGTLQLTGPVSATANNGSVYLPGGIIMKWGSGSFSGSQNPSVAFSPAFPNACFNVQLSLLNTMSASFTPQNVLITAPTKNGFNARVGAAGNSTWYWQAIGN